MKRKRELMDSVGSFAPASNKGRGGRRVPRRLLEPAMCRWGANSGKADERHCITMNHGRVDSLQHTFGWKLVGVGTETELLDDRHSTV